MGLSLCFSCLLSLVALLPALCSSENTFACSRATYYSSAECLGTSSGACGFGEFGRDFNGGDVGTVARLYRNGTGCGTCYQVRCTNRRLCTDCGVKIVVTDQGEGDDGTDFTLSGSGFTKLAKPGVAEELMDDGVVDVEYRRVSCRYPGNNLMFKLKEHSKFPDLIAIIILYQAGQKDTLAVELLKEDGNEWRGMSRAYGGVWEMAKPPKGPLSIRFLAKGQYGQKWVHPRNVIPGDWKAEMANDSGMQLF